MCTSNAHWSMCSCIQHQLFNTYLCVHKVVWKPQRNTMKREMEKNQSGFPFPYLCISRSLFFPPLFTDFCSLFLSLSLGRVSAKLGRAVLKGCYQMQQNIYHHWQGFTNLKFGRVTLKIWQGECKTWQGGPERMLLDVARYISIFGRVFPTQNLAG